MDDPILSKLAWVFGAVVLYGLLRWRLMVATHEFRVRAGVEAGAFARDAEAEQAEGREQAFLAERAYRPTTPWLLVLSLLGAVLRPNPGQHSPPQRVEAGSAPQEVQQQRVRLFWALVSTSPLASLLALVVLAGALLCRSYVDAVRDGITTAMGRVRSRPRAVSI